MLILAAFQLMLLRSEVAPAIAIMILPIFLQYESWLYALSVSLFTAVIAFVEKMRSMNTKGAKEPRLGREGSVVRQTFGAYYKVKSLHWSAVFIGVFVLLGVLFVSGWVFMLVPPLIVTFYEYMRPHSLLRSASLKLVALISLSAGLGTIGVKLLHDKLQQPLWAIAGLLVIGVVILFHLIKLSFGPAVAISLLPTIIPSEQNWVYPIQVTLGIILFIVLGKLIMIAVDKKTMLIRQVDREESVKLTE